MKRIVFIGDSIRQGYDRYVKMALEGIAEVFYPTDNCRFTGYIVRHLIDWKNEMNCGDNVDLVHWNAGLWDDLVMVDGKNHTSVENYEENVKRICDIIKILFPKAKMIFATSTPVREELFTGPCKRYNSDTMLYNDKAVGVVKSFGGYINDLYSTVKDCPKEYYSDMTHLYTKKGTKIIVEQVLSVIEKTLDIKAKQINFDELFQVEKKSTGI